MPLLKLPVVLSVTRLVELLAFVCFVGDRRGQEHSGEEVYSNTVRVFDTGEHINNCRDSSSLLV